MRPREAQLEFASNLLAPYATKHRRLVENDQRRANKIYSHDAG
jgi:hypothetical protein